jgi:starch synthase
VRVAFACAEVFPFAQTGGLGDVCGALPLALAQQGVDVDVYMPAYGCIDKRGHGISRLDETLSVKKVTRRVTVYFVESKPYFSRQGLYGSAKGEYKDNCERFRFFNVTALAAIRRLGNPVAAVHCHDWHAALIPVYLKEYFRHDPFFHKTKSLLTIHNLAYQGLFAANKYHLLGLRRELFSSDCFEFYGRVNFLKAGLVYADRINAVSPQYAKEIQTKKYGCGLERTVRANKRKLSGILNGLDYAVWDPGHDRQIKKRYTAANAVAAKAANKFSLQREAGLATDPDAALYGSVGRLSHQKGIDLFLSIVDDLMKRELQVIVQGLGDAHYERAVRAAAEKYKGRFAFLRSFGSSSAHMVYASSDFFLMPSNFEPCGLSQMIAMKYAAVPIVYKTGGLADTVVGHAKSKGTGIVFEDYSAKGFLAAIDEAQKLFNNKRALQRLRRNAMARTFSWRSSAKKYRELYR